MGYTAIATIYGTLKTIYKLKDARHECYILYDCFQKF